jgi:hypothetical protein
MLDPLAAMAESDPDDVGIDLAKSIFRRQGVDARDFHLPQRGTVEQGQQIAAHQSPRTTKLDDRTKNEISLDEVERIKF